MQRHWFTKSKSLTFMDGSDPSHRVEAEDASSRPSMAEYHSIHTDSSEEDFMRTTRTSRTRQVSQPDVQETTSTSETKPSKTFPLHFTTFHSEKVEIYHQVRGRERHGLLIDPGAASGLIGSETLRLLQPFMTTAPLLDHNKTTPVSGISGSSESTLGEVTLSFSVAGTNLTYTAEVLGGSCPALVGNPALRKLGASLLTQWFSDGDGLLVVRHPGQGEDPLDSMQLFRLLLTDSGHYILPLDDKGKHTASSEDKARVLQLFHHVASSSTRQWYDVDQDVRHCFLTQSTGSDRSVMKLQELPTTSSPISTACSPSHDASCQSHRTTFGHGSTLYEAEVSVGTSGRSSPAPGGSL